MAEETLDIKADFTTEEEDGEISVRMENLHLHLPAPEAGYAYRVDSAGRAAVVTCVKLEK